MRWTYFFSSKCDFQRKFIVRKRRTGSRPEPDLDRDGAVGLPGHPGRRVRGSSRAVRHRPAEVQADVCRRSVGRTPVSVAAWWEKRNKFFPLFSLFFLRSPTNGVTRICFRATIFSYHPMPRCEEKDVARVIRTHVSRAALDWDLSDALPTEL